MSDTNTYILREDNERNRHKYKTGYHAYMKTYSHQLSRRSHRLVILTDITAIGYQWGVKVAVGRKMFIVPRRDEKSVIDQWNKQHPKDKIF